MSILSMISLPAATDIKVRYAPEYRTSLESLENILIYNAQGQPVRVKDVGRVVERFAPPTIERLRLHDISKQPHH